MNLTREKKHVSKIVGLLLSLILLSLQHPLLIGNIRSHLEVLVTFLLLLSIHFQTEWSIAIVVKCESLPVILTATISTAASTQVVTGGNGRSMEMCIR